MTKLLTVAGVVLLGIICVVLVALQILDLKGEVKNLQELTLEQSQRVASIENIIKTLPDNQQVDTLHTADVNITKRLSLLEKESAQITTRLSDLEKKPAALPVAAAEIDFADIWHDMYKGKARSVSLEPMDNNRYRLTPKSFVYSGIYQVKGNTLIMVEPDGAYEGFIWKIRSVDKLELISTQYRGTVLNRGRGPTEKTKPVTPREDLSKKLAEIEVQIKKKPGAPMLYYRKAQCLMKLTRYNEGHDTAKEAMELFIKKKSNLAWMLLESVDLGSVRVDVHLNMGPSERKHPEMGIVKPLSFRIWKKGEDIELLEILDFEIGMVDRKPATAALGKTTGGSHSNFGMLETDAKYEDIRKKALAFIRERHSQPQQTDAPDKK